MQIPPDAQMELEIELVQKPAQATAETDSDREAALLEAKVQPEFGLNARQLDMVREFIEKKGIEYVREKIAVVDSEPRKNAARTFLAALALRVTDFSPFGQESSDNRNRYSLSKKLSKNVSTFVKKSGTTRKGTRPPRRGGFGGQRR
jgi:hypothetical protein